MDRYDRMDYDEGQDDAPFRGGSTEQRDAFLADKAAERARQDADWRARMAEAQATHAAPDAELLAWARPLTVDRTFASRDVFTGYLIAQRRVEIGRALRLSETHHLIRVADALWVDLRRAVA